MTTMKGSDMNERIFNFSAGPATLPVSVIEKAQEDLLCFPGAGMSVLEMSHRSKEFEGILADAVSKVRSLLSVPEDYDVVFLQGGASLQFSMIPMNFLAAGQSADYIITGAWSEKALEEAQKVGTAREAASSAEGGHKRIPRQEELDLDSSAAYIHYTSNNTIFGTQFSSVPACGSVPLFCDFSSDMFSRPIDVSRHGMLYGGVQKNLAPAGATLVILRRDLLDRVPNGLGSMLDYKLMASKGSLYNTPPVFSIYMTGLVLGWVQEQGGLEAIEKLNQAKASTVYTAIDDSDGFYTGHAEKDSRSLMNIPFRLPTETLEKEFLAQVGPAGFSGLKGHRSVGGLRASIYNAFPTEGVDRLAEFMETFRRAH